MRIMIKGGVWKNTEDEILKVSAEYPTPPSASTFLPSAWDY